METPAALFTGLVKTQMPPAIRQLKIEAAVKFFSRWPDMKRMSLLRRVCGGQSKSQSVQNQQTHEHGCQRQAEHLCRCTLTRHFPHIRVLQVVNFCEASARTNARTSIRR